MMPVYGGGGGGGQVRQRTCRMYWCYECARALRIISYPATDVFCPRCYGRFLHEIDPPPRPALPPPGFFPHHFAPHPHAHYHDGNPRRWVVYGAGPSVPGRAFRQLPPPVREPVPGPTRVHAPAPAPPPRRRMPSPPPAPVARRPSTPPAIDPGDYFTGGDLNRLVEELTQNDRPGPAPAAASAIDSLPTVRIAAQHLSDDGGSQCPVCKEEFELGEAARQLPCKHVYHSDCIVPWLRLHNSCPVCRFKLPGTGAASSTRRASGSNGGGGARNRDRQREPATMVRWGPLSWMVPARGTEDPDDGWEYGRHGHGHGRPEAGDAGGNDLSALQSFVLVATCVFFSFFA